MDDHFLARYRALLDAEDEAFDELEHAYEDGDRSHFEQTSAPGGMPSSASSTSCTAKASCFPPRWLRPDRRRQAARRQPSRPRPSTASRSSANSAVDASMRPRKLVDVRPPTMVMSAGRSSPGTTRSALRAPRRTRPSGSTCSPSRRSVCPRPSPECVRWRHWPPMPRSTRPGPR